MGCCGLGWGAAAPRSFWRVQLPAGDEKLIFVWQTSEQVEKKAAGNPGFPLPSQKWDYWGGNKAGAE